MNEIAIPKVERIVDWREIPIKETNEELISLSKLSHPRIRVFPIYYNKNISGSINDCLVRETVADKLIEAASSLPNGYSYLTYDGWRSFEVQKALFDDYKEEVLKSNPNLTERELIDLVTRFVSLPSHDPNKPSTHLTGGSIDLTLCYNGEPLPMGTGFDSFSKVSSTYYFEEILLKKSLSTKEEEYLLNRRKLYYSLINVGFTNYSEEWWHFDYGNQFWGSINEKEAYYGIVKPNKKARN